MPTYVPPRDAYELQLCTCAATVLNLSDEPGIRDRLVDLGLDSPAALRLATLLEHRLGRSADPAALIAGNTVERIAASYRATRRCSDWSSLVCFRAGTGVPLVCVHPLGGNAFWYLGLARRLSRAQPVYGLHARGLDLQEPVQQSITAMARSYISDLQSVVPRGPYLLYGWSFGGIVAFEMARQLQAQVGGAPIVAISDIGPENMRAILSARDIALRLLIHAVGLDRYADELTTSTVEDDLLLLTRLAARHKRIPDDYADQHLQRMLDINCANLRALHEYPMEPYNGHVLLFRAAANHDSEARLGTEQLGWSAWVQKLTVCETAGSHFDALSPENLDTIAPRLTNELSKARVNE